MNDPLVILLVPVGIVLWFTIDWWFGRSDERREDWAATIEEIENRYDVLEEIGLESTITVIHYRRDDGVRDVVDAANMLGVSKRTLARIGAGTRIVKRPGEDGPRVVEG